MKYYDNWGELQPPKEVELFASSLTSKWGFHDGDQLYFLHEFGLGELNTHETLIELVRTKLIPALPHKVELVEIICNHNPIRAVSIDGEDVSDKWYDPEYEYNWATPNSVRVTGAEVLEVAERLLNAPSGRTEVRPRVLLKPKWRKVHEKALAL